MRRRRFRNGGRERSVAPAPNAAGPGPRYRATGRPQSSPGSAPQPSGARARIAGRASTAGTARPPRSKRAKKGRPRVGTAVRTRGRSVVAWRLGRRGPFAAAAARPRPLSQIGRASAEFFHSAADAAVGNSGNFGDGIHSVAHMGELCLACGEGERLRAPPHAASLRCGADYFRSRKNADSEDPSANVTLAL